MNGAAAAPGPASPERIREDVEALSGERNPESSPEALEAALARAEASLRAVGLEPHRHRFHHRGRPHENVVALQPGRERAAPRVLVGAHVDTVRGTPGADDNASGVAGMLEAARLLRGVELEAPVEWVVFNLEERQPGLRGPYYRVGSRRLAADRRRQGTRYRGALVLEMIGYRTTEPGSQRIPLPIRWMGLPRTGDYLAAVGDTRSRALLAAFREARDAVAPDLPLVTFHSPLRGWLVAATRRSDNASFWSNGYPALMLTDTADLRNPHYHRPGDRPDTLDYAFAARVTDAVAETVKRLAGAGAPGRTGPGGAR